MIESLLDVEAAAKMLSLSSWTVRAYIRKRKINAVRIGRRVLIEPLEIERLIEEGRDNSSWQGRGRR